MFDLLLERGRAPLGATIVRQALLASAIGGIAGGCLGADRLLAVGCSVAPVVAMALAEPASTFVGLSASVVGLTATGLAVWRSAAVRRRH